MAVILTLPDHPSDLCQRLWKLQQQCYLCDYKLVGSDGDVRLHRVVLEALCPNMACLQNVSDPDSLKLPSHCVECLRLLVCLLYTGKVLVPPALTQDIDQLLIELQLTEAARTGSALSPEVTSVDIGTVLRGRKRSCQEKATSETPKKVLRRQKHQTQNGDLDVKPKKKSDRASPSVSPPDGLSRKVRKCARQQQRLEKPEIRPQSRSRKKSVADKDAELKKQELIKGIGFCEAPKPDGNEPGLIVHDAGIDPNDKELDSVISSLCQTWNATAEAVYYCRCRRSFLDKHQLHRHSANCRKAILQCRQCMDFFPTKQAHARHVPDCCPATCERYQCHHCQKLFSDVKLMRVHCRSHKKREKEVEPGLQKQFSCHYCPKSFKSETLRASHMHSKHMVPFDLNSTSYKVYSCDFPECRYQTNMQCLLKTHAVRHSSETPFQCAICSKGFKVKHSRDFHQSTDHKGVVHRCEKCDKIFKTYINFKNHMRQFHEVKQDKLLCAECPYQTRYYQCLDTHMYTMHGVPYPHKRPRYQCDHCDFMCNTPSQLRTHVRRHTGELPYQCEVCGKRFVNQSQVTNHLHWHKDERKYLCTVEGCDYAAKSQNNLKIHTRSRHFKLGDKLYMCSICGYQAKLRGNLTLHLRKVHKLIVLTQPRSKRRPQTVVSDADASKVAVIVDNIGILKSQLTELGGALTSAECSSIIPTRIPPSAAYDVQQALESVPASLPTSAAIAMPQASSDAPVTSVLTHPVILPVSTVNAAPSVLNPAMQVDG